MHYVQKKNNRVESCAIGLSYPIGFYPHNSFIINLLYIYMYFIFIFNRVNRVLLLIREKTLSNTFCAFLFFEKTDNPTRFTRFTRLSAFGISKPLHFSHLSVFKNRTENPIQYPIPELKPYLPDSPDLMEIAHD